MRRRRVLRGTSQKLLSGNRRGYLPMKALYWPNVVVLLTEIIKSGLSHEAFDPQACDMFEMPTIVSKESQIVPERGSSDQEVQITDELALLPQGAANLPKMLADFIVNGDADDIPDKVAELPFASLPIAGEQHAFPQFRDCDNAYCESLRFEFLKPPGGRAEAVQVVDHPVGVNQERDAGHRRGSARVINERLS